MSQTGVFMRRLVTLVALALAVAASSLVGPTPRTDATSVVLDELRQSPTLGVVTVMETLDPADEEAAVWAQQRFREAGLSLPPLEVSFHADTERCEGARGGHLIENGVSRVFICVIDTGPTRQLQIKRVLLHEFAHAWDHLALTDQARSEFVAFKGFPGWSFEVPYDERASEDAADIITWGLMDRPILLSSLDEVWSWQERLEGYRILTGSKPPHGYLWSFFAASHDVYAYTATQVKIVKEAWDRSEAKGRLTERIEVRFHEDTQSCRGAVASSELIGDRLHVQVCPGSESELTTALVGLFTGD